MGFSKEAVGVFLEMAETKLRADEMMMVIVVSACSKLGDLDLEMGGWRRREGEKEMPRRREADGDGGGEFLSCSSAGDDCEGGTQNEKKNQAGDGRNRNYLTVKLSL